MSLKICIGDRVTLKDKSTGFVRFIGKLPGKITVLFGIELDTADGTSSGLWRGVKIFKCKANHAKFLAKNRIKDSKECSENEGYPRVTHSTKVNVKSLKMKGIIQFIGTMDNREGIWYGIKLDRPKTKIDGTINGRLYFKCDKKKAAFVQQDDIEILDYKGRPIPRKKVSKVKNNKSNNNNKRNNNKLQNNKPPPIPRVPTEDRVEQKMAPPVPPIPIKNSLKNKNPPPVPPVPDEMSPLAVTISPMKNFSGGFPSNDLPRLPSENNSNISNNLPGLPPENNSNSLPGLPPENNSNHYKIQHPPPIPNPMSVSHMPDLPLSPSNNLELNDDPLTRSNNKKNSNIPNYSNNSLISAPPKPPKPPKKEEPKKVEPPKPPKKEEPKKDDPQADYWKCKVCTFLNTPNQITCIICSSFKPGHEVPPEPKKTLPKSPPKKNNKKNNGKKNNNKSNGKLVNNKSNNKSNNNKSNSKFNNKFNKFNNNKKDNKNDNKKPSPKKKNSLVSSRLSQFQNKGNTSNPPPPKRKTSPKKNNLGKSKPKQNKSNNKQKKNGKSSSKTGLKPTEEKAIPVDVHAGVKNDSNLCYVCGMCEGFEMACHKVCGDCVKKHLLKGIVSKKWAKSPLICPVKKCKNTIVEWIIQVCGLGPQYLQQINEMQQDYMIKSNPGMTKCPKCKTIFMTEEGDYIYNPKEKGLDGKIVGELEQKHKAKWRFRCDNCRTIFCGACDTVPYHLGYTCETWKKYQESKKCRFCEVTLTKSNTIKQDPNREVLPGLLNICNSEECTTKYNCCCGKIIEPCKHECIGIRGEPKCFKCLHPDCKPKNIPISSDDFCNICWVDTLRMSPSLLLQCGHMFHFICVRKKIEQKWPGARIVFGFLDCPLCKKVMSHPALKYINQEYLQLKDYIKKEALERLRIEGLHNDPRLQNPNDKYYKNEQLYAMDRLAFYMCYKCKKPYFGGLKACEEAGMEQNKKYNMKQLICGSCASGPNSKRCKKHGRKYITYKCKFCCNISNWFCWGNTHFCDDCHKKQESGIYLNRLPIDQLPKCPGPDKCPLGVKHPPNGKKEFSLGCMVCKTI